MENQREVVTIIGMSGAGKTTKMRELLAQHRRVFLIDPMAPMSDKDWEGWAQAESLEDCREWSSRSEAFHVRWTNPPKSPATVDAISWLAMQRGDVTIAIDEIHLFVSKQWNTIPRYFKEICLIGRHYGVNIIATSQRPSQAHNDFLSQCRDWYLFQLVLNEDIDALPKSVRIGNAERLPHLKIGECIHFAPQLNV